MGRDLQTIVYDRADDGTVRITLNRPDRLNAMNHQLVADLHTALDAVHDDEGARVVILTGAGRAFCAGLDLKDGAAVPDKISGAAVPDKISGAAVPDKISGAAVPDPDRPRGRVQAGLATQRHIAELIPHLRGLRVPVIAAVNGAATGGGLALALGSDIRVAGTSARFGVAFVKIGLTGCDIGVSWALPRLVGASRAHELMLTGRIIDAAEADRIGLVTRVVDDDDLLDAAEETAAMIRGNSPLGIELTKEAMWSSLEIPSQRAAIDVENRQQILTSMTGDMAEAVSAFLEKRPPEFGNR